VTLGDVKDGYGEMDFRKQREAMVERYKRLGYLHSERMAEAMRMVPRELFMPKEYREYAYHDQPYLIPGDGNQTISAPYTYAMFYEPLGIKRGDKVLEVGTGSGYGATLARELVEEEGKIVTMEVNSVTFRFGKMNLEKAGYRDIVVVCGDGSKGYSEKAPYDKICVTAACPRIPEPLTKQLKLPGKLVAPVGPPSPLTGQNLILLKKNKDGKTTTKAVARVIYVPLKGEYGWK
jgi:protein-L-isoaspartate(D-aspartate) O-methyltransferase